MNEFLLNPEDQRLIDLLVDGELSAEHRRDLLQRFEQEPAGWRSCALAFLEAQSWRGDLRAFVKEPAPVVAVSAPVATVPAAQRSGYNPAWLVPLYTLAAALLVALGMSVGWKLNPYLPAGAGSAQQFAGSLAGAAQTVSGQSPAGTRPARPWGKVNLVVDSGNNRADTQVQVPIDEGQGIDDRWLREQPAPVPGDVVRALEQMGNQVRQQRRLLPFRSEDGRQLVVPVDQVDVQPVDLRAFQ